MRPYRARDQRFSREVIEPTGAAIALSGREHQRQVTGASGFVEAIREPDEQLLGNGQPVARRSVATSGCVARDLGVMGVALALLDRLNTHTHLLALLREHPYCFGKPIPFNAYLFRKCGEDDDCLRLRLRLRGDRM
jgi:hypothetical protein